MKRKVICIAVVGSLELQLAARQAPPAEKAVVAPKKDEPKAQAAEPETKKAALPSPPSKPEPKIVDATQESLKLDLLGTIISSKDPNDNVVLIKFLETSKVDAFRIGFRISGQYWVSKITKEYIDLADRPQDPTTLTRIYSEGFGPPAQAKPKAAEPGQLAGPNVPASFKEDGFERENNDIKITEEYKNKIKDDLPKILMQASAEAAIKDGEVIGFTIDQIEEGSIFQKAGLADGDIITAIDGKQLSDVTVAIRILHSLKTKNDVSFEFIRGSETIKAQIGVK